MLRRAIRLSDYESQPKLTGPLVFPQWGPMIALGAHAQIQAQAGHMAIVQSAGPGQFLVTVVPEIWRHQQEIVGADGEVGFLPLVIPAAAAASRILHRRVVNARTQQQVLPQQDPYLLPGTVVQPLPEALPVLQAQGRVVQPCLRQLPAPQPRILPRLLPVAPRILPVAQPRILPVPRLLSGGCLGIRPLPAPAFMDPALAGDLGLEIGCDGQPCACDT